MFKKSLHTFVLIKKLKRISLRFANLFRSLLITSPLVFTYGTWTTPWLPFVKFLKYFPSLKTLKFAYKFSLY